MAAPQEPDARWTVAAERTLFAWFRLALALFVAGAALVALVPPHVARVPVTLLVAGLMLGCGAAAVTGVSRWHRDTRRSERTRAPTQ